MINTYSIGVKLFLLGVIVLFIVSSSEAQVSASKNILSKSASPNSNVSKKEKGVRPKRKSPNVISCYHPNVADLILSKADGAAGIYNVKVTVDNLFSFKAVEYRYDISGGKIIGNGRNIRWDTTGLAPGEYSVTAGLDDGCGVCGTTKTSFIVIK